MRKFLNVSLVVALVFALSAVGFAAEGSLDGGNTLEGEIDAFANIGPYAALEMGGPVDFGTLVGQVGLYTANGFDSTPEQFYHRAASVFGISSSMYVSNNNGWGSFHLETNTDADVAMDFDNSGWLESPSLFAIAKQGAPDSPLAWASSNFALGSLPTSFTHLYQVGSQLYGIDGAIYIESISQQAAQSYAGVVTITVSK